MPVRAHCLSTLLTRGPLPTRDTLSTRNKYHIHELENSIFTMLESVPFKPNTFALPFALLLATTLSSPQEHP